MHTDGTREAHSLYIPKRKWNMTSIRSYQKELCLVVCYWLVCSIGMVHAQGDIRDLVTDYRQEENPEVKADLSLSLEHKFRFTNRDSAMYYITEGMQIAADSDLSERYLMMGSRKASLLALMGRPQEGIQLMEQLRTYAKENGEHNFERMYAYRKGMLFEQLDMPDSAIYYLLRNKELAEPTKYMTTLTIGEIYSDIGDQALAGKYLQEALEKVRLQDKEMDHLFVLSTLIDKYESWSDYEMVSQLKEEYLKIKTDRGDDANKILGTTSHAHVTLPSVDMEKQVQNLKALIPVSQKNGDYRTHAQSVYKLVQFYNHRHKYTKAVPYLDGALASARNLGNTGIIYNLEYQSYQTYKATGNMERAFEHLEMAYALKDSLRNDHLVQTSIDLATQYETERKENEIALLKAEDEVKSLQLQRARQSRTLLGVVLIGAIGVLSLLCYLYLLSSRQKRELEDKNKIIQSALADKNILLREIHHRVKNNLQVISSILNLQSNYISDSKALEAINEGKNRVSSMALIHSTLYQNENITSIDTRTYFTDLISSLYDSYEIDQGDVELHLDIDEVLIDVDTMVPLGLVVNELVSNALKHAFKGDEVQKNLTVSLRLDDGLLELVVKDNGVGIDMESFLASDSFGNKLIQAFKQKLKAELEVKNGDGTEVRFVVSDFEIAA